jgi:hypothetical protein
MPGSPYLEEIPPGLLTWPKLLMFSIPTLSAITIVAWWQNLLIEWGIGLTILLVLAFFVRR